MILAGHDENPAHILPAQSTLPVGCMTRAQFPAIMTGWAVAQRLATIYFLHMWFRLPMIFFRFRSFS